MITTDKPTIQGSHIEGVKHITPLNAMDALKNEEAVLIDVRETAEVELERVPLDNVLHHPMSVIMERLPYISKNQNIIVGCPGGARSAKVANLLNMQGFPHVANLDGGFTEWKAQGLPFESNDAAGGDCCSSCGPTSSDSCKNSCC